MDDDALNMSIRKFLKMVGVSSQRELEHAVERAVILANRPAIRERDLPPEIGETRRSRQGDDTLNLEEQERRAIARALERFGGNRRRAADALHISTVTLWRKMRRYGLAG